MKSDVKLDSAGLTLAGHLYIPDSAAAGPHSAIVVSRPVSGVKEQSAGLYTARLAEHGFITLTFDAAYQARARASLTAWKIPCTASRTSRPRYPS
jgi:fermentation-respiration switch protein FrsA (DUF1100 family)